ncbi:MAG: hypothetical protein ACRDZ5_02520 [Acidimicrobiales bacterium]
MAVREDCRHYICQSVGRGERVEACRLGANHVLPFGCPEGCVLFEARRTSRAGWQVPRTPGTNPSRPAGD